MIKTTPGLIILFFSFTIVVANAQKTDSLKVDTNLLNKYRIEPRKNALPFRFVPIEIQEAHIPESILHFPTADALPKSGDCLSGWEK